MYGILVEELVFQWAGDSGSIGVMGDGVMGDGVSIQSRPIIGFLGLLVEMEHVFDSIVIPSNRFKRCITLSFAIPID